MLDSNPLSCSFFHSPKIFYPILIIYFIIIPYSSASTQIFHGFYINQIDILVDAQVNNLPIVIATHDIANFSTIKCLNPLCTKNTWKTHSSSVLPSNEANNIQILPRQANFPTIWYQGNVSSIFFSCTDDSCSTLNSEFIQNSLTSNMIQVANLFDFTNLFAASNFNSLNNTWNITLSTCDDSSCTSFKTEFLFALDLEPVSLILSRNVIVAKVDDHIYKVISCQQYEPCNSSAVDIISFNFTETVSDLFAITSPSNPAFPVNPVFLLQKPESTPTIIQCLDPACVLIDYRSLPSAYFLPFAPLSQFDLIYDTDESPLIFSFIQNHCYFWFCVDLECSDSSSNAILNFSPTFLTTRAKSSSTGTGKTWIVGGSPYTLYLYYCGDKVNCMDDSPFVIKDNKASSIHQIPFGPWLIGTGIALGSLTFLGFIYARYQQSQNVFEQLALDPYLDGPDISEARTFSVIDNTLSEYQISDF